MTGEKRSLHNKLAQVMYEAERIPKNGTAPAAMGGFKFVQVGDAADAIRKALAEHQISMVPSSIELVSEAEHPTSSGKVMTTMTVRTTWTLTDGETGETAVIQSMGSGADMGDKAAPKAQSSAMKYALLMGFLLSTGDDPEQSDTSDRRQRQSQAGPSEPPVATSTGRPRAEVPEGTGDNQTGAEVEEMMGRVERRGTIRKGTAAGYKLEYRAGPSGAVVGFKLEVGDDKAIPQCLLVGPIADGLQVAYPDASKLVGTSVKVAGVLYHVKRSDGPGSWYRLHVDRFENADWILPADPEPALPAPPDDVPLAGETAA